MLICCVNWKLNPPLRHTATRDQTQCHDRPRDWSKLALQKFWIQDPISFLSFFLQVPYIKVFIFHAALRKVHILFLCFQCGCSNLFVKVVEFHYDYASSSSAYFGNWGSGERDNAATQQGARTVPAQFVLHLQLLGTQVFNVLNGQNR